MAIVYGSPVNIAAKIGGANETCVVKPFIEYTLTNTESGSAMQWAEINITKVGIAANSLFFIRGGAPCLKLHTFATQGETYSISFGNQAFGYCDTSATANQVLISYPVDMFQPERILKGHEPQTRHVRLEWVAGMGEGLTASDLVFDLANESYTLSVASLIPIQIPACDQWTINLVDTLGSGNPTKLTKYFGEYVELPSNMKGPSNYTFIGWSKTANSSTPDYKPGGYYIKNEAATLYAVWRLDWQMDLTSGYAYRQDDYGQEDDTSEYVYVSGMVKLSGADLIKSEIEIQDTDGKVLSTLGSIQNGVVEKPKESLNTALEFNWFSKRDNVVFMPDQQYSLKVVGKLYRFPDQYESVERFVEGASILGLFSKGNAKEVPLKNSFTGDWSIVTDVRPTGTIAAYDGYLHVDREIVKRDDGWYFVFSYPTDTSKYPDAYILPPKIKAKAEVDGVMIEKTIDLPSDFPTRVPYGTGQAYMFDLPVFEEFNGVVPEYEVSDVGNLYMPQVGFLYANGTYDISNNSISFKDQINFSFSYPAEYPTAIVADADMYCNLIIQKPYELVDTQSFMVTILKGEFILDFSATGLGMGIGTIAPSEGLHIGWNTTFFKPIYHTAAFTNDDDPDIDRYTEWPFSSRSDGYYNGIQNLNYKDGRKGGSHYVGRRMLDGSNVWHGYELNIQKDGTRTVFVSDQAAWRNALGLGTMATQNISAINQNIILNGNTAPQIRRNNTGTSWVKGRDVALLRAMTSSKNSWDALISSKTPNGSWEAGTLGEYFYFSYATDTNYNSGNNFTARALLKNNISQDFQISGCVYKNSYYGMVTPEGSESAYIRSTSSGIIPYSANSTGGSGSLGTDGWPWGDIWGINLRAKNAFVIAGQTLTMQYVYRIQHSVTLSAGSLAANGTKEVSGTISRLSANTLDVTVVTRNFAHCGVTNATATLRGTSVVVKATLRNLQSSSQSCAATLVVFSRHRGLSQS